MPQNQALSRWRGRVGRGWTIQNSPAKAGSGQYRTRNIDGQADSDALKLSNENLDRTHAGRFGGAAIHSDARSGGRTAGRRNQPLPATAQKRPGGLVALGAGGAGRGGAAGPADPAVDRLSGLPLVPCDAGREFHRPGHRGDDERGVRQYPGRPRGAARYRRAVPGGGRHDGPAGRLADEHLPDAGRPALLWRTLFPARGGARHARLPRGAGGRFRHLPGRLRQRAAVRLQDHVGDRGKQRRQDRRGAAGAGAIERRLAGDAGGYRPLQWRLRAIGQISPQSRHADACGAPGCAPATRRFATPSS